MAKETRIFVIMKRREKKSRWKSILMEGELQGDGNAVTDLDYEENRREKQDRRIRILRQGEC